MQQLTLNLTDAPETVTRTESLARSRSAKREAYNSLNLNNQHTAILDCIIAAGSSGLTRHEIAAQLGIPLSSVCGRVNELLSVERPVIYVASHRRDKRSVLVSRV